MFSDIKNLIKEKRLPYSWTLRYHKWRYLGELRATLHSVRETPPQVAAINSQTELHLQICQYDIDMAILAIKSLLRFNSDISVIIHDDNTFTDDDFDLVSKHITNVVFYRVSEAEQKSKQDEEVWQLRQAFHKRFDFEARFNSRIQSRINKIFDIHAYSEAENILYLDSDIIFTKEPTELRTWMADPSKKPFHTEPPIQNVLTDPEGMVAVFPDMEVIKNFNSGFFGFRKSQIPYSLMLGVVKKLLDNRQIKIFGDESVWRIVYGHVQRDVLDCSRYPLFGNKQHYQLLNDVEKSVYMHFIYKHQYGHYAREAAKVINELM
jgi:hypothetical protein